jgi:hypothetical protein
LTSAPVGDEWSASRPGHFTPGERAPDTYWVGGCVGPRAGLDDVELHYTNIDYLHYNLQTLKYDMFRPLLGHHQVYCLCFGAELAFNMDLNFEYDYITRNIMLCNKTLGIIYFFVQLCWY